MRLQRAADVWQALRAREAKELPLRWFEAMAFLEGQAEEMAFREGLAQDKARAKAAVRQGRWP